MPVHGDFFYTRRYTVTDLYQKFRQSKGVSTDMRTLLSGQIYFGLTGHRFDGNAFAAQALAKGASLAVVSDRSLQGDGYYHVDDTLVALQDTAREHRKSLEIPVLGITGSNGKTTTKELIAAVLEKRYRTSFTQGNLNNHIGVPLSVLAIPQDCEFAIIEMGANHVGEIAELSSIAMPDHGLITNIGMAHIEGFGSREGIKRGKSELYNWLSEHDGIAFVNADEEFLPGLSAHVKRRVFYGTGDLLPNDVGYRFRIITHKSSIRLEGVSPNTQYVEIESGLFGEYNARNILTAVTIGLFFGVDLESITSAIRLYLPDNNRSQVVERGEKLVVLDAYNANPTSMHLALESFVQREGTKAAILGGMNELGDISHAQHLRLVSAVADAEMTSVYLVGEHFNGISLPDGVYHFENVDALCKHLESNPISEELILIKGSRSLRLESALGNIH